MSDSQTGDENEWGSAVTDGLVSTDDSDSERDRDDDFPARMTEEEVMALGDRGQVESVTLHQPTGSDEWTAKYGGIEVTGASRVGALESLASEMRGQEE